MGKLSTATNISLYLLRIYSQQALSKLRVFQPNQEKNNLVEVQMVNISISCKHNNKSQHTINRVEIENSKSLYNDAIRQAKILKRQLNPHAPNGEIRDDETIEAMAFSGYIAEKVVIEYLNHYFSTIIGNKDVIARSVPGVFRGNGTFNQIDIEVINTSVNQNRKTIEVRSSNIMKGIPRDSEVYNTDQSLVGKYNTTNKQMELPKDFYIIVLFRHNAEKIKSRKKLNQSITLDIAGGASKQYLLNVGTQTNLKQPGALYQVINPVSLSISVPEIAQEIYNSVI